MVTHKRIQPMGKGCRKRICVIQWSKSKHNCNFSENLECFCKSREINVLHSHWRKKKKVHRLFESVKVTVTVLINTRTRQGSL